MKMNIWMRVLSIVMLAVGASAQPYLQPEEHFLGIPGVDSVCTSWFLEATDSTYIGFNHPWNLEVLKLSDADYRVVFLDDIDSALVVMPMDQQMGVPEGFPVRTGVVPDTSVNDGTTVCQMRTGDYFNPTTDRIAIGFWHGSRIGVYQFDSNTNTFTLERTFSVSGVKRPVGLFWAFDQFFITDNIAQKVFRTNSQGDVISVYGYRGISNDDYRWISDIDGYVDESGAAHLYVSDGRNQRVDHLVAYPADPTIYLESQVLASPQDSVNYNTHEVVVLPGYGVVAFDRTMQRFYVWDQTDALNLATRASFSWEQSDAPPIHMWDACGRIIVSYLSASDGQWSVRSFLLPNATLDNPVTYPSDHWTTAHSPVYITSDYLVASGEELIIDAGVEVLVDQDVSFKVGGSAKLTVNGTTMNPVQFKAMDAGETWDGITVKEGQLDLDWTEVSDVNGYAITTIDPEVVSTGNAVSITNSTFSGNGLMLTGSPAEVHLVSASVIEDVPSDRGLYLYNCYVSIDNLTVSDCVDENTYIKKVSGKFTNCIFEGETDKWGVFLNTETCNPTFYCCQFLNMGPPTGNYQSTVFSATGCNPVFGYPGSANYANVFSDRSTYLLSIQGKNGPYPVISGQPNDFIQNDSQSGKYVQWVDYPTPAVTFAIKGQYWNMTPLLSHFTPSDANYWSWYTTATIPFGPCGGGGSSTDPGPTAGRGGNLDDDPAIDDTLLYAIILELDEEFAAAQELYLYVLEESVVPATIWTAASRVITTDVHLEEETNDWIPELFDDLMAAQGNSYDAILHGKRILSNYYLNHEEYETAISLCLELFESGLSFDDSIFVATDLIGFQIAAGIIEWGSDGLDSRVYLDIPEGLRVESFDQGLERERSILDLLGSQGHGPSSPSVGLPTEFALYQNFPNPFNPSTQISYDLPERVRVQILIYNTLGQIVTVLHDKMQYTGRYTITWDGKSAAGLDVATGMYIYQIKAGSFIDAKKMLLLK